MFICSALYFLWTVATATREETSYVTLTYPLIDMDETMVTQWGIESSNNWKDFMNGDINFGKYKQRGNYKWSPLMINTVDGVAYKNWGQFQSYTMHLRNLFKSGSMVITNEANTTVINDTVLNVYFCVEIYLSLSIGGYEPFTPINKCINRRQYFAHDDDDMTLIRSELTSDGGMGVLLFNYVLQTALTTILPQYVDPIPGVDDGVHTVLSNPVLLSIIVIIVLGTTLIGLMVYFIMRNPFRRKDIKYKKISRASSSEGDTDHENVPLKDNKM